MQQALEAAMALAIQRHQAGDVVAAQTLYGKVLTEEARHPVALHNLGLIRLAQGDHAAALVLLAAAVQEKPREPVFHFNLGLAQQTAGNVAAAATAYRQALQFKPDYRKAWENLGVALQDQEQYDEALQAYRQALAIDPCSPVAHKNMGNILRTLGRLDEAEIQYQQALDCNPLDTEIGLQAASTRLSRGDFSAWDRYEWRYWSAESLHADEPLHVPLPKWDGQSVAGQSLLLYGEQGIGDEIMFASCIPEVSAMAARTALLCDSRLAPLFKRSFPEVTVEARSRGKLPPVLNPQGACDLRSSLASLPQHVRRTAADFPGTPYLVADAAATASWQSRLRTAGVRLVIGISWRGGAAARAREGRAWPRCSMTPASVS
jgi:tetratricopeptide (TPR) repeat protein